MVAFSTIPPLWSPTSHTRSATHHKTGRSQPTAPLHFGRSAPMEAVPTPPQSSQPITVGKAHARRLREIYRSAGWPSQDPLEIELLAAGLLSRERATSGHESLRVTDAGVLLFVFVLLFFRRAFVA